MHYLCFICFCALFRVLKCVHILLADGSCDLLHVAMLNNIPVIV